MKLYISDTHFRHKNILRFDNRPWFDTTAMEEDMICLWNDKVRKSDDVYILGDFCWGTADDWRQILPKLHGRKHLILGNHDLNQIPQDIRKMFASPVEGFREIKDGDYRISLCHYPCISYKHDIDPKSIMLYGHVHNTTEFEGVKKAIDTMRKTCSDYGYLGNLYNCWCGFYEWAPATLEEILSNPRTH